MAGRVHGQLRPVRFKNYGLAPRSAADFAFLLHGFHYLKDVAVQIFPWLNLWRKQSKQPGLLNFGGICVR